MILQVRRRRGTAGLEVIYQAGNILVYLAPAGSHHEMGIDSTSRGLAAVCNRRDMPLPHARRSAQGLTSLGYC